MAAPALDLQSPEDLRAEIERLRMELRQSRAQTRKLTEVVRDQAKTLAAITDDCPPWAPSLAILYWLYAPTRWNEKHWGGIANKLRHLLRDVGDMPAAKLTPMAWEQHRARRRTELTVFGRPPTEGVLNNELAEAKALLNWAVENRLLKYSPLATARAVKTILRRETRLPPDDLGRLLAGCPKLVNEACPRRDDGWRAAIMRAFVLCLHDSLLRFNEARAIMWDRIGTDGRVELFGRQTKGGKRRSIFLTPITLDAIVALQRQPGNPYVFSHRGYGGSTREEQIGQPIGERRLRYWFRRLAKITGIDALVAPGERRLRPHDLRASGATTADELGARPTAIRDALGHARMSTTEIYLRSSQAENARSVRDVMATATGSGRRPAHRSPRKKPRGPKHFSVAGKLGRTLKGSYS